MNTLQIVLRIIHIVGGVTWAGGVFFNSLFLFPAMRHVGPDAAKVGAMLMRMKFGQIMGIIGATSIVSGLWLYSRYTGGFHVALMKTGPGMAFATGGVTAIIALGLASSIVGPTMLRAATLTDSAMQATDPAERERALADAQSLRIRANKALDKVAFLLAITVLMMAIGRYA
jgi:uncharacterized membrane protein